VNKASIQAAIASKKDVVITDIEFCRHEEREKIENQIGTSIHWVYLKNAPWQCAKNCLFRYILEKKNRPLQEEIDKIKRLSEDYTPPDDALPVVVADSQI
jgi:DNA modification methylase